MVPPRHPLNGYIAFRASPRERRGVQELPVAYETFAESVPASKDVPDYRMHPAKLSFYVNP